MISFCLSACFLADVAATADVPVVGGPVVGGPVVGGPVVGGPVAEGRVGRRIAAFVNSARDGVGHSGAVLAARDGKVIAAVAVGESEGKPIETTTLFELASCTKPLTALAVFRLQEQGKLSVEDPISKHLPGVPEDCQGITVRHLLQHTSGIPGTNASGAGTDLSVVLPKFLAGGPRAEPGARHEYWNQGYSLLSEVIARASGRSYVDYVRAEVFQTAGMEASCFTGDELPAGATAAVGESSFGKARSAVEHPYGEYGFQYRGMGGAVSNVWDLWRLDRALAAGEVVSAKSYGMLTDAGKFPYALGWQVGQSPAKTASHSHSGKVRGFLAAVSRYPEDDGCLIVLTNSDAGTSHTLVKTGVERLLFGERPNISFPSPLWKNVQAAVVGEYRDSKSRSLTMTAAGPATRLRIDWGGPVTAGTVGRGEKGVSRLYMFQGGAAPAYGPEDRLRFRMGAGGQAQSITLIDLKPPLVFNRVSK